MHANKNVNLGYIVSDVLKVHTMYKKGYKHLCTP